MKNQVGKLSIVLTELKMEFKIEVKDSTKKEWKQTWKINKDDKEKLKESLEDAKSWLWNMGDYNGQANKMMNDNHDSWMKFLRIYEENDLSIYG
jgi:hypothetical protein